MHTIISSKTKTARIFWPMIISSLFRKEKLLETNTTSIESLLRCCLSLHSNRIPYQKAWSCSQVGRFNSMRVPMIVKKKSLSRIRKCNNPPSMTWFKWWCRTSSTRYRRELLTMARNRMAVIRSCADCKRRSSNRSWKCSTRMKRSRNTSEKRSFSRPVLTLAWSSAYSSSSRWSETGPKLKSRPKCRSLRSSRGSIMPWHPQVSQESWLSLAIMLSRKCTRALISSQWAKTAAVKLTYSKETHTVPLSGLKCPVPCPTTNQW